MVADVLEQLVNADAHLEVVEALLAGWPNSSASGRERLRAAVLALYYINNGKAPTQDQAMALVVTSLSYDEGNRESRPLPEWYAAPSTGIDHIIKARVDQVVKHGHTPEHDRTEHGDGSLAHAAAAYALAAHGRPMSLRVYPWPDPPKDVWPHDPEDGDWFERKIRQLAVAGALCAAEIDRMKAEKEEHSGAH
jgi:hypothetical protein